MAKVMDMPRVGIDDDFRKLGGDSIQMMTMQTLCAESELQQLRGISTSVIYQGCTPREMARMLAQTQPKVKVQMDDYPLSVGQMGYFNACMKNGDEPVANIPILYRVPNQVDLGRLIAAIEQAVDNHPAFSTRLFVTDSGEPRQKTIAEPFHIVVEQMDADHFEAERKKLIQPYRMLGEPLFRIRLFEVADLDTTAVRHYLFIDANHILFDGTSRRIFYRDIDRAYRGLPLEAEDWTLGEMAADECSLRQGGAMAEARDWFRRSFDKDRLVPPVTGEVESERKPFDLKLSYSEVERYCQKEGVTMNAITTAAFMLTLGGYADTEDVTILTAFNGREDARTRNTVGYFATNLPVRAHWKSGMAASAFVHQVGQALVDSMAHSLFCFGDVVGEWGCYPAYQFICQGELTGELSVDGIGLEEIPSEDKRVFSLFEFQLFFDKPADGFRLIGIFSPQTFSDGYIRRWTERYTANLKGLMTAPTVGQAIADVPGDEKFAIVSRQAASQS